MPALPRRDDSPTHPPLAQYGYSFYQSQSFTFCRYITVERGVRPRRLWDKPPLVRIIMGHGIGSDYGTRSGQSVG